MSEKLAVVIPVFNEPSVTGTLRGLYDQNRSQDVHHIIVDNGCTDNTREKIEDFMRDKKDFPLTVVEESQKGTGAASDTGFRLAIQHGFSQIARIDGDTIPRADWTQHIENNFSYNSACQLMGGRTEALRDENYRIGDSFLMPVLIQAARIALMA